MDKLDGPKVSAIDCVCCLVMCCSPQVRVWRQDRLREFFSLHQAELQKAEQEKTSKQTTKKVS